MDTERLPVAVIGLGDIAQKAYLPVLSGLPGVDMHLVTRDAAKLNRIGDAYRVEPRFTSVGDVVDAGVRAAFVHTPTQTHAEIVTQLLEADVDVLVDKPLSYDLAASCELVELARQRGRSLLVAFNRRYTPAYVAALDRPRNLVLLQKDRTGLPNDTRTVVLDDFIHVVETLRMLVPAEPDRVEVSGHLVAGLLHHVVLHLAGPGFTALGVMNRVSGSITELLQTSGDNGRYDVRDLTEVTEYDGAPTLRPGGIWDPVGHRRGFEAMCRTFLDAVRSGQRLGGGDALVTHELCEQIIGKLG